MEANFRQSDHNLFRFASVSEPGPANTAPWFRLDDVATYDLPGGRCLLVNRRTGHRGELPASFLPLLNDLLVFRTLDDHARAIHARLAASQVPFEQVATVVNELSRAGILVSAGTWLEHMDPGPTETGPWAFVLTTCDRPGWFARATESATRHLATALAPQRIIVIDDSRSEDSISQNRARAVELLDPLGFPVDYWDRARRESLARQLADAFPAEAESIRWLLAPSALDQSAQTFGQVRNLMTLLTPGLRIIAMDDDCELAPRVRSDAGQEVQLRRLSRSHDALGSVEELMKGSERLDVNPLQQHLDALGTHPFDALERLGQANEDLGWLQNADAPTLDHLSRATRIAATRNGLAGDPGTPDELPFYARSGDAALRNTDYFNRCMDEGDPQRIFWRTLARPAIYFDPALMSILLGLDNRSLLPCVPPAGRGSNDDVLGALMAGIHPDQARFEFAWALPHRLDEPAPWRHPDERDSKALAPPVEQLGDLLQQFVAGLQGTSADSRLTEIVAYLRRLARMNDADLRKSVDESRVSSTAFRLRLLAPNLEDQRIQGKMRDEVQRYARNLEDLMGARCAPDTTWLQAMRSSCAAMADGLRLWPRLREYVSSEKPV
ncbi:MULTISPECIES: hypothetical protein [unclassified Thioalkalivibrio]|uniref:hypothetical protein n=1 Tax=unclassified Thioalkalivibrio TaxID=2621013 RepID=UPI000362D258|nr:MULTISPECIES: hypothetical protein [unclassified Thioalkalivibrio]